MSFHWDAFLPALRLRFGERADLTVGSAITLAEAASAVELITCQNCLTPLKAAALWPFAQSSRSLS